MDQLAVLRRRERLRKRWAQDPEYRRKRLKANRAWIVARKDRLNARRRYRYATDPEYREKCRAPRRGEHARNDRLKLVYGMTPEDYDAILARQNGACAICESKSHRRLCIDHCHSTGTVRGLLCRDCNLGLGNYQDDPKRLLKAIVYLKRFRRISANRKKDHAATKLPVSGASITPRKQAPSASPPRTRPAPRSATARSAD